MKSSELREKMLFLAGQIASIGFFHGLANGEADLIESIQAQYELILADVLARLSYE